MDDDDNEPVLKENCNGLAHLTVLLTYPDTSEKTTAVIDWIGFGMLLRNKAKPCISCSASHNKCFNQSVACNEYHKPHRNHTRAIAVTALNVTIAPEVPATRKQMFAP
jgi:hypothetical protein